VGCGRVAAPLTLTVATLVAAGFIDVVERG
jgi:hypothetical protein